MLRHAVLPCVALLCFISAGCDQKAMIEKMVSPSDRAAAEHYVDLLRKHDYAAIEKALAPSLQTPQTRQELEKMAAMVPAEAPLSIKIVGAYFMQFNAERQANLSLEYQFPSQWVLAQVTIQRKPSGDILAGFHVTPMEDSLENLNRFTLSGKPPFFCLILALTIAIPLFTIATLIVCIRTRVRFKWLWIIFIILGVGRYSINSVTGEYLIQAFAIQLFGSRASAAPYGPWIFTISVPLGAIVFLLLRKRLKAAAEARLVPPELPEAQGVAR